MSNMDKNRLRSVARYDAIITSGNTCNTFIPRDYRDCMPSLINNNCYTQQMAQSYGSSASYAAASNQQNRTVSYNSVSTFCTAHNTHSINHHRN
jgi:hypothetical protein